MRNSVERSSLSGRMGRSRVSSKQRKPYHSSAPHGGGPDGMPATRQTTVSASPRSTASRRADGGGSQQDPYSSPTKERARAFNKQMEMSYGTGGALQPGWVSSHRQIDVADARRDDPKDGGSGHRSQERVANVQRSPRVDRVATNRASPGGFRQHDYCGSPLAQRGSDGSGGVSESAQCSIERTSDASGYKIHDSVGSIVQKRNSPVQKDTTNGYERQYIPKEGSRRSASWDVDPRDERPSCRKTISAGPQAGERPNSTPRLGKRVSAVQQSTGFDRPELDSPQRPWTKAEQPVSPEYSMRQQNRASFEHLSRRLEPRLSEAGFDVMRTMGAPSDLQEIAQNDLMRSGDARWDFLQSTDVCWDVGSEPADRMHTPGPQSPWAESGRPGVWHRAAGVGAEDPIRSQVSYKEHKKHGPLKTFIGKVLGGCLKPGGDNKGFKESVHDSNQRRASEHFPQQQPGRQSTTLGRFASRQRFMVNLIEEGRLHPASSPGPGSYVQREI